MQIMRGEMTETEIKLKNLDEIVKEREEMSRCLEEELAKKNEELTEVISKQQSMLEECKKIREENSRFENEAIQAKEHLASFEKMAMDLKKENGFLQKNLDEYAKNQEIEKVKLLLACIHNN